MAEDKSSMMGAGAASGIGAIVGVMGDEWNRQQTNSANRGFQSRQARLNEEMAQRNQQRNKEMWDYTNYENQVKHMEGAGLNKALMYGGSGGGGATAGGAQGQGAGMPQASPVQGGQLMAMQTMKEMALMQAQKENIEADTANKKADANYTGGSKTNNTDQDTNNKYQDEALKAQELANKRKTADDEVALVKAERIGQELQNLGTAQNTAESQARVSKMAEDVAQGWQSLSNEAKKIKIQEFEAELKAKYPSLDAVAGGQLNNLIQTLYGKLGLQQTQNTVK